MTGEVFSVFLRISQIEIAEWPGIALDKVTTKGELNSERDWQEKKEEVNGP